MHAQFLNNLLITCSYNSLNLNIDQQRHRRQKFYSHNTPGRKLVKLSLYLTTWLITLVGRLKNNQRRKLIARGTEWQIIHWYSKQNNGHGGRKVKILGIS